MHTHIHDHGLHGDHLEKNILISIALNGVIVVMEVWGGIASGSLSLLSDAMHNMSDVAALSIALFARRLGHKGPTDAYTYGMKRAEIIAAMINTVVLLLVISFIIRGAVERFFHPRAIHGGVMLVVALVAFFANLFSVFLLKGYAQDDLNTQSALLHLAQDTASSAVIVGIALVSSWRYGPYLDATASILVALAVLFSAWQILKESFRILMEATPADIEIRKIKEDLERKFPGIDVHHIHVWVVGAGQKALTAHVMMDDCTLSEGEKILKGIAHVLAERWGLEHVTLQPEVAGCGSTHTLGAGFQ